MKDSLSSKDRMLMAIDHEEPDHVPLVLRPFGRKPPPHLGWRDGIERADKFLSLGIDDTISIGVPFRYHPDVSAGPGGAFILSRVDMLFEDTPWGNVLTMI